MAFYPDCIARCQHIKINGTQCGSPALRRNRFCYFHKRWSDQRIRLNSARARSKCAALDLPVLEDANSIQVALMQVMRLLASNQLDHKTAGLLLYALQTASVNLRNTDFEPRMKTRVVINPKDVSQTTLNEDPWDPSQFEEEEEELEEEEPAEPAASGSVEDDDEDEEAGLEIQAVADDAHVGAGLRPAQPCKTWPRSERRRISRSGAKKHGRINRPCLLLPSLKAKSCSAGTWQNSPRPWFPAPLQGCSPCFRGRTNCRRQ